MNGKVCLVTGATSGIGEVTARVLAKRGATVIVVGRNAERGAATLERIRHANADASVELMLADLSSIEQIRKLADEFKRRYSRLDVLVNNAGAIQNKRMQSVDGIELTWALNHLNYFLLTNLLLDVLKASAPARIVNVSSRAHYRGSINFDDLQGRDTYRGLSAYGQSKLANVLFTYELARRLESERVTANVLHPGFVATNFAKNNGGLFKLILPLVGLFALSPEKGAQTMLYLATSSEVEGVSGKYFNKSRAVKSSTESYDENVARRLWQVSEEMSGLAS